MISSSIPMQNVFLYNPNVGKSSIQRTNRIIFLPIKAVCKLTRTPFQFSEAPAKITLLKVAKSFNYLFTWKLIHIKLSLTILKCLIRLKDSGIVKPLLIITNLQFCKMSLRLKIPKIYIWTGEESCFLIVSANRLLLIERNLVFVLCFLKLTLKSLFLHSLWKFYKSELFNYIVTRFIGIKNLLSLTVIKTIPAIYKLNSLRIIL